MRTDVLEVRDLSKRFGALVAVSDLNFGVRQGEILGLIGPNGAGKTTAINLISGRLQPDRGRIFVKGEDVTALSTYELTRRGVVRTFQATNLYQSSSLYENVYRGAFRHYYVGFWGVLLQSAAYRAEREKTAKYLRAMLAELDLRNPDEVLAQNLPYGHQKILGLAIALAAQPSVLLLDEPAAGLAADEATTVAEFIKRVNGRGVTIVLVDHNMRFISKLCDRIVVLHHGTELMTGTPEEVINDTRVIEAYLGRPDAAP